MCLITLRDDLLNDADTGGVWSYLGYHPTDPNGTPASGGTSIGVLIGDNPSIDTTDFLQGFYFFRYTTSHAVCGNDVANTAFEIGEYKDAGQDVNVSYCSNDTELIDLFSLIGGSPTAGGSWTLSSGFAFSAFDANAGTINMSQINSTTSFTVQYSISTNPSDSNYTLLPCSNCSDTSYISFTVSNPPYAGQDTTVDVCVDDIVLLSSIHNSNNSNSTPSGEWIFFGFNDEGGSNNYSSATFSANGQTSQFSPFHSFGVTSSFTLSSLHISGAGQYLFFFKTSGSNSSCSDQANVVVSVSAICCVNEDNCYYVTTGGASVYGFNLLNGSVIDVNTPEFTFPYQSGQQMQLQTDLNTWLSNNGGGTATVTFNGLFFNITINNPCIGFDSVCTNSTCSRVDDFTQTNC